MPAQPPALRRNPEPPAVQAAADSAPGAATAEATVVVVDADQSPAEPPAQPRIVPVRRTGQWVAATAVILLLAMVADSVVRNDAFQWDVVGDCFGTAAVLRGLGLTLWLTTVVVVLGFALGTVIAVQDLLYSVQDLLYSVQLVYHRTYRIIPLPLVATIWYVAVTSVLSVGQYYVELRFSR
ncbi:hypothetical protein [Streptomyces sp. H27-D2]|uniref:hypothetical protein n=1 Tax=Streptomyces sp. H27-D2 TaxID=3046304 RepID=UPI002DB756F1|nr:hypothetical protein [Streptomyces sp. H27-D2]MEC4019596.1 hypothetical protein [Streptomyces sp. H27-D2]